MSITVTREPDFVSAARNPVVIALNADPAWATYSDYYIKVVVQQEKVFRSFSLTSLSTSRTTPNADGKVVIDLSPIIESLVQHEPPTFPALIYTPDLASLMLRRYAVTVQEWRNGNLSDARSYPFRTVVNAGFGPRKASSLLAWTHTDKKFLTHQPRIKKVSDVQPEWLYYMVPAVASLTAVRMKIEPITESGIAAVSYSDAIAASIWDIVKFPAGYRQLRLNLQAGVIGWRVSVEAVGGLSDGLVISEVMEYKLDCECNPLDRYFLFENSLGGYDTVRLRGKAMTNIITQQVEGVQAVAPDASRYARQDFTFGTRHRYEAEQATGYLSKEEAAWLHDLLRSDDVYRIGDIYPNVNLAGELTPVVRESGSVRVLDDENVYKIDLKYREAIQHAGL